MDEKPPSVEQRREFQFEIREIFVWTTIVAILLPWFMPRVLAMDSAAQRRLLMLSAIVLSVPATRIIIAIQCARRASKLRGRLLFSHAYQHNSHELFLRGLFVLKIASQFLMIALQFFQLLSLVEVRVGRIDIVVALLFGFMLSLYSFRRDLSFFHVQLFERGFVQFGRYITWDKYHTITVQELPNWAILLLDPVDESLPKEYHRIIALPLEKLPAVRVVVDLISSEMARR